MEKEYQGSEFTGAPVHDCALGNEAPPCSYPETWRATPGFEGYEVSDHGNVRSVDRTVVCSDGSARRYPGCLLKFGSVQSGHQIVTIKGHTRYAHELVMLAFVGPRPEGMIVLHGPDHDPTNNRLCNLRYGTPAENFVDSVEAGTHRSREGCPNLSEDVVRAIRAAAAIAGPRSGARLAARFGVHQMVIGRLLRGQTYSNVH